MKNKKTISNNNYKNDTVISLSCKHKSIDSLYLCLYQGDVITESDNGFFWLENIVSPESAVFIQAIQLNSTTYNLYSLELSQTVLDEHNKQYKKQTRRDFFLSVPESLKEAVGYAFQFHDWFHQTNFCNQCASSLEFDPKERNKTCLACKQSYYPKISPCIIVLVTRGEQLLLGLHQRSKTKPYYTLLAGFINGGETVENAVHREVFEESRIKIKDPVYQFSQFWPFNHSLMLAFRAQYQSGTLTPDKKELIDLQWFDKTNLPELPPNGTISRCLIDQFISNLK